MYKNVCIRENVKRMCAMAQNTLRYAMQTCCMFCVYKYNTQHWEDTGKNIHDFQGESEEKVCNERASERAEATPWTSWCDGEQEKLHDNVYKRP